jgi:hypothetical protein
VPLRVPAAVGLNVTEMVQLPPAVTELPTPGHVPEPAKAKSPVMLNDPVMVRAEVPVLVSVAVITELVVPTVCSPNFNGLGDRLTVPVVEEAPVPLRLTVCVVAVDVNDAVRVPVAVGLKVTLIVQLLFAASEELHPLNAKSPAFVPERAIPGVTVEAVVFESVAV